MVISHQKAIDPFFTGGKHFCSGVFCLSQTFYDMSIRTIGKTVKHNVFFKKIMEGMKKGKETLLSLKTVIKRLKIFVEEHENMKIIMFFSLIELGKSENTYCTCNEKKLLSNASQN